MISVQYSGSSATKARMNRDGIVFQTEAIWKWRKTLAKLNHFFFLKWCQLYLIEFCLLLLLSSTRTNQTISCCWSLFEAQLLIGLISFSTICWHYSLMTDSNVFPAERRIRIDLNDTTRIYIWMAFHSNPSYHLTSVIAAMQTTTTQHNSDYNEWIAINANVLSDVLFVYFFFICLSFEVWRDHTLCSIKWISLHRGAVQQLCVCHFAFFRAVGSLPVNQL